MHAPVARKPAALIRLAKPDANASVFRLTGRDALAVKAGTVFNGHRFKSDAAVEVVSDDGVLVAGADYGVTLWQGVVRARRALQIPEGETVIGGFHYAPGGHASARIGGDDIPAINPYSFWDINFRPDCRDPRGMALVESPSGTFWCDIYLTGANCHLDGTSKFEATIADGNDPPVDPATGERFKRFDYAAACAVMSHHGKGLLGLDEFPYAAFGVTEKSAHKGDPRTTGLDAPRTSRFGLMQATGNLWVWGHDGDPDEPRASMFGGSWIGGDDAGSRYAHVAYIWPEYSGDVLGARGRSDHMQLDGRCDSSAVARAARTRGRVGSRR